MGRIRRIKRQRFRATARILHRTCRKPEAVNAVPAEDLRREKATVVADACPSSCVAGLAAARRPEPRGLCDDFDITSDFEPSMSQRRQHYGPIEALDCDTKEHARRAARAARFAAEAQLPAPPLPQRRVAWYGGKMTTNREAATKMYLARCGGELSSAQRRAAQTMLARD